MNGADFVEPNSKVALKLRTSLNQDFFESLSTLVEILSDEGFANDDVSETIEGLEAGQKLSGYAHVAYHLAVSNLEKGNLSGALNCLSLINSNLFCEQSPRIVGFLHGDYSAAYDDAYFAVSNASFRKTYKMDLDISKPSVEELLQSKDACKTALGWIRACDASLYDELSVFLTDILLMRSDTINAASSVKSYGVVRMSHLKTEQSWTRYFENLVHEAAHQHLNYVWHQDELILNEDAGLFSSPLRKEPRPLSGIFHAAFVLARTMRGLCSLQKDDRYDPYRHPIITGYNNKKNAAGFKEKFDDCVETLEAHAEFSAFGMQFFGELKNFADRHNEEEWFREITRERAVV